MYCYWRCNYVAPNDNLQPNGAIIEVYTYTPKFETILKTFQAIINELHRNLEEINSKRIECQIQDDFVGIGVLSSPTSDAYEIRWHICPQINNRASNSALNSSDEDLKNNCMPVFSVYEYKQYERTQYYSYTDENKLIEELLQKIRAVAR